jgi:hypothetical protein
MRLAEFEVSYSPFTGLPMTELALGLLALKLANDVFRRYVTDKRVFKPISPLPQDRLASGQILEHWIIHARQQTRGTFSRNPALCLHHARSLLNLIAPRAQLGKTRSLAGVVDRAGVHRLQLESPLGVAATALEPLRSLMAGLKFLRGLGTREFRSSCETMANILSTVLRSS